MMKEGDAPDAQLFDELLAVLADNVQFGMHQ